MKMIKDLKHRFCFELNKAVATEVHVFESVMKTKHRSKLSPPGSAEGLLAVTWAPCSAPWAARRKAA